MKFIQIKIRLTLFCPEKYQISVPTVVNPSIHCLIDRKVQRELSQEFPKDKLISIMLINKYKRIKRLGRDSSGQTFLVQDQKGTLFALKVRLLKLSTLNARPLKQIKQVLLEKANSMKQMESPNIVKLLYVQTDQTKIYLLYQYCNGGDLLNYQSKLPQRVFKIERATEILAKVIAALQCVHKEGNIYNSIKGEKILFSNQNATESIKIMLDLPSSEQQNYIRRDMQADVFYKSPQFYSGQFSGFYVDMWALGVLLYFMLNMQYPFRISPFRQSKRNEKECISMAADFSYSKSVEASRKKLVTNCMPEMQDLFKKMFEPDPLRRMKFDEIRQHLVFKKYFPQIQYSTSLYNRNLKEIKQKIIEKKKATHALISQNVFDQKAKSSSLQDILQHKRYQIAFLNLIAQEFMNYDFLSLPERLMLAYNLKKYYIVLLREFHKTLKENLNFTQSQSIKSKKSQHQAGLQNKNQHSTLKVLQNMALDVEEELNEIEFEFVNLYRKCQNLLELIETMNNSFINAFTSEITDADLQGDFKRSYRRSTMYVYRKLKQREKDIKDKSQTHLMLYVLVLVLISHAFNNFPSDLSPLEIIFRDYLSEKRKKINEVDFRQLIPWMKKSQKGVLKNIGRQILRVYFG